MKTGIAPRELLETPPNILYHMIRYTLGVQDNGWEALDKMEISNG